MEGRVIITNDRLSAPGACDRSKREAGERFPRYSLSLSPFIDVLDRGTRTKVVPSCVRVSVDTSLLYPGNWDIVFWPRHDAPIDSDQCYTATSPFPIAGGGRARHLSSFLFFYFLTSEPRAEHLTTLRTFKLPLAVSSFYFEFLCSFFLFFFVERVMKFPSFTFFYISLDRAVYSLCENVGNNPI